VVRKQIEVEVFVPVYKQLISAMRRSGGFAEKELQQCLAAAKVRVLEIAAYRYFWQCGPAMISTMQSIHLCGL